MHKFRNVTHRAGCMRHQSCLIALTKQRKICTFTWARAFFSIADCQFV